MNPTFLHPPVPGNEQMLRRVRNRTVMPQTVGMVSIPQNGVGIVDVAPGTIGDNLVRAGILQICDDQEPVEVLDLAYRCPVCPVAYGNGADLLAHICSDHTSEVLQVISQISAGLTQNSGNDR